MKKLTAVLLALLIAFGTLTGCKQEPAKGEGNEKETTQQIDGGKETQQQNPTKDDTDPVETFPPTEDFIKDYDQDDSQQGFSIKGKGYYYKGCVMDQFTEYTPYPAGEVLLLNVTNETDTNYIATLTVTYLDENGEKIKTEKQTFKQFAAGYQKYFLFNPQKSYASYTCELSLTEYTGEIWADKFSFSGIDRVYETRYWVGKLQQKGDYEKYPSILAILKFEELSHPALKRVAPTAVLFDNTGEIYLITDAGGDPTAKTEPTTNYQAVVLYQTTEEKLVWPEELKGELKAIVVFDIQG